MSTITTERAGRVLRIGLNRPDKLNAFNLEMLRGLAEAYAELDNDDDLWCGLLYAHGSHFTSGLDLAEVGPKVAAGSDLFGEGGLDPLDLTEPRRTKPVVCAVQGYCFTIGVELLLAADVTIAATDTKFSQMEVCRGIMPFGGATLRFPQIAGWGNAMRWMLTGERFDAAEALRMSIVQQVEAAGAHLAAADAIATSISKQAPLAVRATREASRVAMEQGRAAALATLMTEARGLMRSEDAAEGVRSFVERRAAEFKGA